MSSITCTWCANHLVWDRNICTVTWVSHSCPANSSYVISFQPPKQNPKKKKGKLSGKALPWVMILDHHINIFNRSYSLTMLIGQIRLVLHRKTYSTLLLNYHPKKVKIRKKKKKKIFCDLHNQISNGLLEIPM